MVDKIKTKRNGKVLDLARSMALILTSEFKLMGVQVNDEVVITLGSNDVITIKKAKR